MKAHGRFVVGAAVAAIVIFVGAAIASAAGSDGGVSGPTALEPDSFAVSAPARTLSADRGATGTASPRVNPLGAAEARSGEAGAAPADPLAGRKRAPGRTPAPNLVFDGVSNPIACGGCLPPDTTGDVGPNHYVQMVNATKVQIFNKAGTSLAGPFNLSTLFPPASGNCASSNAGDPQVLYDPMADRWLLSQFQQAPNRLCFAISQTANPTGAYFTYAFTTPEFPDYFKVGVWPTGYYVGSNESNYSAYAFNRAKMLAGDPTANAIRFTGETNLLMPADVDGATPPPTEGGLFYTFKDNAFHGGGDRLELFRLNPNFATPAASTFTMIDTEPVAPFTYTVCGFFNLDCIPQPGTIQGLDPVSEWPMQRFVYRNFGSHQTLLGNFTVDVGSDRAGIRWFELRNTGSGYGLFQEGTQAPADGLHRWMGSIAMDGDGNIALGYSTSSSTQFPTIEYATRCATDPPGTLGPEVVMKAGAGSQTSSSNRWGDYSAMNVDPADDQSFWYTNEYYKATSSSTWSTSIGRFDIPAGDCGTTPPPPPPPPPPPAEPSNDFSIDKVKRNKRNGTAKIFVDVPGPGRLDLRGNGIKSQRPATRGTRAAKPVNSAGTTKLKVKAKGKKKKKLKRKGKVKVKAKITYEPTGGSANTKTKKIKLKRKRK